MSNLRVQRFIYTNYVLPLSAPGQKDRFGNPRTSTDVCRTLGVTRAKAILFASPDSKEVLFARQRLMEIGSFRARRALDKYEEFKYMPKVFPAQSSFEIKLGKVVVGLREENLRARAADYVNGIIDEWYQAQRLSALEVLALRKDLESGRMQEYLLGFGYHLAMKMVTDIMCYIAFGMMATGEFGIAGLLISTEVLTRTAYTGFRMHKNRGQDIPYGRAIFFGLNPLVGGLFAYPLQMMGTSPKVSKFIIGNAAFKIGRLFGRALNFAVRTATFFRVRSYFNLDRIGTAFLAISNFMNTSIAEFWKKSKSAC